LNDTKSACADSHATIRAIGGQHCQPEIGRASSRCEPRGATPISIPTTVRGVQSAKADCVVLQPGFPTR